MTIDEISAMLRGKQLLRIEYYNIIGCRLSSSHNADDPCVDIMCEDNINCGTFPLSAIEELLRCGRIDRYDYGMNFQLKKRKNMTMKEIKAALVGNTLVEVSCWGGTPRTTTTKVESIIIDTKSYGKGECLINDGEIKYSRYSLEQVARFGIYEYSSEHCGEKHFQTITLKHD